MTYPEKLSQLEGFGVNFCVEEPFQAEFASTSAQDFFFEILLRRLRAKALVVGPDFAFGRKREGNIELLKRWCQEQNIHLEIVQPLILRGEVISSSRIRQLLQAGELAQAEACLGKPFFYRGEIVHGDKRGRTIGFPTANMECEEKFPLPPGVYATSVFWRAKEYASVTNIGRRPTFHAASPNQKIPLKIETHILDQTFDLYGEQLEVRFFERIRDEQRFDGVESLKSQIAADVILARKLLSSRNF
jgi:riboflavin kinase/FMN adenylyltransferase